MTENDQLLEALQRKIPDLRASADPNRLRAYSRDCWPIYQARYWQRPIDATPGVVVWPKSTEDVVRVYKFANDYRTSVTTIGLGSGVVGGGVPEDGAIVLDMKMLDQYLEVDSESHVATADVGWNGQMLEDALNAQGFTAGHFPSSIMMSSLGGWMAARGAGQLSTRYGKFEDRLIGCRWVFPDGSEDWISQDYPQEGLLELLAGSEGTLGTATQIQFKIDPVAEIRRFAAYDFKSVKAALNAMRKMMQAGVRPAAVRLYDPLDTLLHTGLRKPEPQASKDKTTSGGVTTAQAGQMRKLLQRALKLVLVRPLAAQQLLETVARKSMLVLMFEGPKDSVAWQEQAAHAILAQTGQSIGEGPGKAWFAHRYSITGKQADVLGAGGFFDTMEVAFPWSRLHEGYQAVRDALRGHVLLMAHFSHVYADGGCIYFSFVGYQPGRQQNEKHYLEVWRLALDAVVRSGGTITHHHGVGLLKARWMADEWQGGHTYLKFIKAAMDPNRIANPGKLGI